MYRAWPERDALECHIGPLRLDLVARSAISGHAIELLSGPGTLKMFHKWLAQGEIGLVGPGEYLTLGQQLIGSYDPRVLLGYELLLDIEFGALRVERLPEVGG